MNKDDKKLRRRADDGSSTGDGETELFLPKEEERQPDEEQPAEQPYPPPPAPKAAVMSSKSFFFFMILVGQSVGTQTFFKLSQKGGSYEYNTMSAMAVVEGVKLTISFGQLAAEKRGNLAACTAVLKAVERRVYFAYIFLAFSYAAYNQLIFHVMKLVDPGTFALFKSLMPAAVAFLNFVTFGKTLTQPQVLCILIQMFGIVPVATSTNSAGKVDFTYGAQSVVVMTLTILFASFNTVFNASVVKKESANYPMNVQNSILYSAGCCVNLLSYSINRKRGDKAFFYGYKNLNVFVLLFLNSTVGITISMVYKYGDAILKTLSQPLVSAILVFLSNILFDAPLDIIKLSGAGTVIVSTMLYLNLPAPPASETAPGPLGLICKRGGLKFRAVLFTVIVIAVIIMARYMMSMLDGEIGAKEISNFNQTAHIISNSNHTAQSSGG